MYDNVFEGLNDVQAKKVCAVIQMVLWARTFFLDAYVKERELKVEGEAGEDKAYLSSIGPIASAYHACYVELALACGYVQEPEFRMIEQTFKAIVDYVSSKGVNMRIVKRTGPSEYEEIQNYYQMHIAITSVHFMFKKVCVCPGKRK